MREDTGLSHAERHARLFERIARPYAWFFHGQLRTYARAFELGRAFLPDPAGRRALDIGCGTGAFTRALAREGWEVRGVDVARAMLERARSRGLSCDPGDALRGLAEPDGSFDLVTAAYVAHGLRREDRAKLFSEMRRLSRDTVLFQDYTPDRNPLVTIVEYLEHGDYFNFIRTGLEEMRKAFPSVRVVRVGPWAAWYVCKVDGVPHRLRG